MDYVAAGEQPRMPPAARPHLPPELLLKVFGYVPDRKTHLTLRSVCKTFRNLVDSEIFSTSSCTLPLRFDGSAGSLCGVTYVTCLPSQLHQLAEASAHITSVILCRDADERDEFKGNSLFTSALISASEVLHLATWPALRQLTCTLKFENFLQLPPTSFSALRELDLTFDRCNPSYITLIGSLHGLETLHLTDRCVYAESRGHDDGWPSVNWRSDTYPTFAISLWAAIAGLERLAELHLEITDSPELERTLTAYLNAPEGSFLSVKQVFLNAKAGYNGLAVHSREAGQFVRQFPHLEHLTMARCRDWPEGMGVDLPWPQLKTLKLFQDCFDDSSSQLPSSIRDVTKLQTLAICGAYQVTSLPEWIGELTQLATLQMPESSIVSLPQSMTKLQHLTSLDLSNTEISQLPDDIDSMTALADLNLGRCNNLTALPVSIANLARLTRLDIGDRDELTEAFGMHLPLSLKSLDLWDGCWPELPTWIARLTGLRTLDISNNGDLQYLPPWLGDLAELRELHMPDMRCLSPDLPEFLGRLSRLTLLDLGGYVRFASIPASLAALPHLTINAWGMTWDGARWKRNPKLNYFPCPASMYNELRAREEARKLAECESEGLNRRHLKFFASLRLHQIDPIYTAALY